MSPDTVQMNSGLNASSVRAKARRRGYRVSKARGRLHSNNHGGYMLSNDRNMVVDGVNYDLSLHDIEEFLARETS